MRKAASSESVSVDRRRVFFALALIGVLTFIVFSPSLENGFVNWDDAQYVLKNPVIRNL